MKMNLLKLSSLVMAMMIAVMLLLTGCGVQSESARDSNSRLNLESLQKIIGNNTVVSVSAGIYHSLALTSDGKVFGAGIGTYMGMGSNTSFASWTDTGLSGISAIACGQYHCLVIKRDGVSGENEVYVTGDNSSGQLGLGDKKSRYNWVPTGKTGVSAIAAGIKHSAYIKNKIISTCGDNTYGQLARESTNTALLWKETATGNALAVACGSEHTVELTVDGRVFAAGNHDDGQLGIGDHAKESRTFINTGMTGVSAIAAGSYHTLCIKNGTVWATGYNEVGQLGLGDYYYNRISFTPTNVTNAIAIACGASHSVCLQNNLAVYTTGNNNCNQLAYELKPGESKPEKTNVFGHTNCGGVTSIAGGFLNSFYIAGGKVYDVGLNSYGQLGVGNSTPPIDIWIRCP